MKKLLLIYMLWLPIHAEDVYLAQAAAGGGTGANCENAKAITFFGVGGNWGTGEGKISAGDIVHLCGTITSKLWFQGGGAIGSPVTLLFETGANISVSPGCGTDGCVNLGGNSYIAIDGGVSQPCGWNMTTNQSEGTCNGVIRNMLYGSTDATCPGGACTTQADSGELIKSTGSSNIEIRNLELGPSYIHTTTGSGGNDYHGTGCIYNNGGSNWNIHNNKLHDGGWCATMSFGSGTVSNIVMSNNEFYNNSHMTAFAGSGSGSIDGVTFSGNYFHDMYMWDTTSMAWHADAIHFYGSSGSIKNITIYNNIFGGNTGHDVTGQIFTEAVSGGTSNIVIFNNVFNITSVPPAGSNYLWGPAQCTSCSFYNNTLNGGGTSISLGYSTNDVSAAVANNIIQGAYWLFNVSTSYVTLSPFNFNAYGPNTGGIWGCRGGNYNNFTDWKAACSEGSSSIYNASSLGLDTALKPQSVSPVIGAGVNVCTTSPAFCTSHPAIGYDITGNPRPASGPWDIGAYQYASGSGTYTGGISGAASISGKATIK